MELERVKALGVKPPQNLWEYKVDTQFLQGIQGEGGQPSDEDFCW